MSTKKILITASTYPRWPSDSTPDFVQQYARHLADESWKVTVLAPHAKGAKTHETDGKLRVRRYRYFFPADAQNITYNGGGVDKIQKSPLYAVKLIGLLGSLFFQSLWLVVRKRIAVMNPHWIVPQGFVAVLVKFLTGRRVVLSVHGGDVFSLTGSVMTRVKRFVLKHSDAVCVNSNATRQACEAIYQREYNVIPMGIDMQHFTPQEPARNLIKKFSLDSFTILFVGRMSEVKGCTYLLQALRQLADEGYQYTAILAGDGPLKPDFETYVKENNLQDRIVFPGWIDQHELNDYYSVADVLAGPSLSEAQGLVFVEALASGTPVVASRVGGIIDIVADGETGYLVAPKSSDELCQKLKLLIDDPDMLKQFSQKARASVEQRFSWTEIAKQYSEVIKEVGTK